MTDKPSMEAFEDEVDRLADQRGISFSAALDLMNVEAPRPTKKQVTRKDLDELGEGIRELGEGIRELGEMQINRIGEEAAADGTINRIAEERGISVRDATLQMEAELRAPYRKIRQESAERRARTELARHLEVDPNTLSTHPHVETPEEERERYGYTTEEAEARAKRSGVGFRDACVELSQKLDSERT